MAKTRIATPARLAQNKRAFTLVELLLAVLIVGVITTFSVLTFNAI